MCAPTHAYTGELPGLLWHSGGGIHAVHDRRRDGSAPGEPPVLHGEDDVHAALVLRERSQTGVGVKLGIEFIHSFLAWLGLASHLSRLVLRRTRV